MFRLAVCVLVWTRVCRLVAVCILFWPGRVCVCVCVCSCDGVAPVLVMLVLCFVLEAEQFWTNA